MGYQVVMTRDTDNFIALQDRVRIANRHNNAIFISIHFNDGGSSARGVETFTLAPAGTSSSMSRNIRHDAPAGQRPGQHEHCPGYSRPGAHAERTACHQGGHFHG